MARPTILIGIGSGGLRSIEAAWKLSQEIDKAQRPIVEYIYLETDKSNQPVSSDIVYSSLTLDDPKVTINALVKDISCTSSWISNISIPNNILSGAGGAPAVGRLTIWDSVNRNNFITNINAALTRIRRLTLDIPLVYVVGSFGGGTGSGTFLDVAYLIRDTLANKAEIHGLFMIPHTGVTDRPLYSNTVCCLKELEYFNNENNDFPFRWSANPPIGYDAINTPFDSVQIISTDYNRVLPKITYSQLHEDAGLFLYLNTLGMYDVRFKSLKDASDKKAIQNYTTFGLAAVHYPETEIKEILGNRYAAEMLGNIINEDQYFDKNLSSFKELSAATPQIVNKVKRSFDNEFTKILRQWCEQINIVESGNTDPVEIHIKNLAHTLASGNYSYDEKRKLLYNLFKVGGEYYKQLKNLSTTYAMDKVINLVIDMVSKDLQEYNNINIAIIELEAIESVLKDIQDFWKVDGYTPNTAQWEANLKNYITQDVLPMPSAYKILIEKEKVYADRIRFILLYGLSMHVFSDNLSKIIEGIQGTNNLSTITITTSEGKHLPTIVKFKKWKEVIERVIENPNNANHLSCKDVEKSLIAKLSATQSNISYIYPYGSLEQTLLHLDLEYKSTNGQYRFIKDITGNDDLYAFLISLRSNINPGETYAERDLYAKVVPYYLNQIATGGFSVAQAVCGSDYNDLIRNVEGKSLIPHVPVNPNGRNADFIDHANVPHIIAAYDGPQNNIIGQITSKLENDLGIHDYKISNAERDKFSHSGLNNWLIFYKEFGHMSDNAPFNIINDLRDFNYYATEYSAELLDNGRDENSAKLYHEKRMPYIDYSKSLEVAKLYENKAIEKQKLLEYEDAIECYKYARYWNMAQPVYANKSAELAIILNQETSEAKFDRYYQIAGRYMQEQNFPAARNYYLRARNENPNDSNAISQIQLLDNKATQISTICNNGDTIKKEADILYDRFIRGEEMLRADCIQKYKEANMEYEKAINLSKFDIEVKQRMLNVKRRLSALN